VEHLVVTLHSGGAGRHSLSRGRGSEAKVRLRRMRARPSCGRISGRVRIPRVRRRASRPRSQATPHHRMTSKDVLAQ